MHDAFASCPARDGFNHTLPCSTTADADLLGFGVRLGAYMQAAGAIVGLLLDPAGAPGEAWIQIFTAVPVLVLALIFALHRSISNALFLAITYLTIAQTATVAPGLFLPSPFHHKLLGLGIITAVLATCGLLLWFWSYGFGRCCAPVGGEWAFFFVRVAAFGWFRWLNIGLLSLAIAAMPFFVTLLFYLEKAYEDEQLQLHLPAMHTLQPLPWRNRLVHWLRRHHGRLYTRGCARLVAAVMLCMLGYVIAGVECTLQWNGVTGVYSLNDSGQLVAMLLGAGTLLRPIYLYASRKRHKRAVHCATCAAAQRAARARPATQGGAGGAFAAAPPPPTRPSVIAPQQPTGTFQQHHRQPAMPATPNPRPRARWP